MYFLCPSDDESGYKSNTKITKGCKKIMRLDFAFFSKSFRTGQVASREFCLLSLEIEKRVKAFQLFFSCLLHCNVSSQGNRITVLVTKIELHRLYRCV